MIKYIDEQGWYSYYSIQRAGVQLQDKGKIQHVTRYNLRKTRF